MDKQTAFLRTIRHSLGLPVERERAKESFPALFSTADTASVIQIIRARNIAEQDELVRIFHSNAEVLGIYTHVVASQEEVADVIVNLALTMSPEFTSDKQIVHHDHPDLNALQLSTRLDMEGFTVHTTLSADTQLREKTIASFIGITAPDMGVAESATLVQLTTPGCPRSTSLVPSIHIAVLKKENVVADLREAYALLQEEAHLDSMVFITGPSKTADIEAQMVHGAHGPREVHVLIY
jgi:L-lactate dehydrogenase complex protein LldG